MTTGERCVIMYIKKIVKTIMLFVIIVTICICVVSCNTQYVLHYISYESEILPVPLKTCIIRNPENIEEYFTFKDYIAKGKNFEVDIAKFTNDFFNKKVLIPIVHSIEITELKSIKVIDKKIEITLKRKKGAVPDIIESLCFLELDRDFVGDATEVNIIYI